MLHVLVTYHTHRLAYGWASLFQAYPPLPRAVGTHLAPTQYFAVKPVVDDGNAGVGHVAVPPYDRNVQNVQRAIFCLFVE